MKRRFDRLVKAELSNRNILFSLALAQALNSASIPISIIVASLTIVDLAHGNGRWAGVPSALTMLGGATATFLAGKVLPKVGYRKVLGFAGLSGMSGALLAAFSSMRGLFFPFLAAFLFLGMAIGLIGLSRYAAGEVSEPEGRARAMGRVVLGSTAGAILGPLLVAPFGQLALHLGLPKLVGPWMAACLCYLALFINIFFLLRPEPESFFRLMKPASPKSEKRSFSILKERRIFLPMGAMIAAQLTMVLVMAITPLHMHSCHHGMASISKVIAAHFIGMFGLSMFSGWLADRLGRMPTVGIGGLVLAIACVLAPISSNQYALMLALFLLGLGWSFCFIGGSSALAEGLADSERAGVQGLTETMISLASGTGSLSSGLLFTSFGFSIMTLVGLVVSGLPCFFYILHRAKKPLV
jgi:MFS family permease